MVDDAPRRTPSGFAVSVGVFGALLAVALLVYWPALSIPPVEGDNYYVLDWASRARGWDLLLVDPAIYPEWRPFAYESVWAQFRGLESLGALFFVNIALVAACAWLVFRLVLQQSLSMVAALASATFAVTDPRAGSAVTWIVERQSTMACLFGLMAMALDEHSDKRGDTVGARIAGAVLLMASMLSKEYGMAFAAAIALRALWARRGWAAFTAMGAAAAYLIVRVVVVQGAVRPYCTEAGYFFTQRVVCFDGTVSSEVVGQALYNVGATLVGSLLPGLFTADGAFGLSGVRLAMGLVAFALMCVGWVHGSPLVRSMGTVVVVNACLSVLLYRDRNQLTAVYASAVPVGVGLAWLMRRATSLGYGRRAVTALAVTAFALIAYGQGVRARQNTREYEAMARAAVPCREQSSSSQDLAFADALTRRYGVPDADCGDAR